MTSIQGFVFSFFPIFFFFSAQDAHGYLSCTWRFELHLPFETEIWLSDMGLARLSWGNANWDIFFFSVLLFPASIYFALLSLVHLALDKLAVVYG